jgi:hypothetical protein
MAEPCPWTVHACDLFRTLSGPHCIARSHTGGTLSMLSKNIITTQERATQDTTLRECNRFIEMMSVYVCADFLRSQKYFARCRDNTSTTRAIPSANNQCKFALLTQSNTHAHTVGTNDDGCGEARF